MFIIYEGRQIQEEKSQNQRIDASLKSRVVAHSRIIVCIHIIRANRPTNLLVDTGKLVV